MAPEEQLQMTGVFRKTFNEIVISKETLSTWSQQQVQYAKYLGVYSFILVKSKKLFSLSKHQNIYEKKHIAMTAVAEPSELNKANLKLLLGP